MCMARGGGGIHGEEDAEDEGTVDIPQDQDARKHETPDAEPGTENVVRRQICHEFAVVPVNVLRAGTIAVPICNSSTKHCQRSSKVKACVAGCWLDGTLINYFPYCGPLLVPS